MQAGKHVERGSAHAHGEEEKLPLHSQHREWAMKRAVKTGGRY